MFYADSRRVSNVAERIRHYHERLGHYWRPAPMIKQLAAANCSFEEWDRQKA
jgi:3-hydroxyacyl-CoA dehydrogenase